MNAPVNYNVKHEQRGVLPEIPFGYEALLTGQQRQQIDLCRGLGWVLHFIRRPKFHSPTVVMQDLALRSWQVLDNGYLQAFTNLRQN